MSNLNRAARIKPEKKLNPDHRQKVIDYVSKSVPEKHQIATQRALLGQVPRSVAIRVHCLQCTNYQRDEVSNCTVIVCALHPVRPYQNKNQVEDVEEATDDNEEE